MITMLLIGVCWIALGFAAVSIAMWQLSREKSSPAQRFYREAQRQGRERRRYMRETDQALRLVAEADRWTALDDMQLRRAAQEGR